MSPADSQAAGRLARPLRAALRVAGRGARWRRVRWQARGLKPRGPRYVLLPPGWSKAILSYRPYFTNCALQGKFNPDHRNRPNYLGHGRNGGPALKLFEETFQLPRQRR